MRDSSKRLPQGYGSSYPAGLGGIDRECKADLVRQRLECSPNGLLKADCLLEFELNVLEVE